MSYDLLIRNGTIVDGTGAPPYRADIGVRGGAIAVIGKLEGATATEVIDAEGQYVAPGFIDPHTHYDAQICWDQLLSCSPWHGATTVITGSCGIGLAPVRPDKREIAAWDLVNLESIPFEVLQAGVTWDWETFPEYLDAADRRGLGINIAPLVPLTCLRRYVIGDEATERAATPEETGRIRDLLKEAMLAGGFGFSTSNGLLHIGYQGRPLACRLASEDELKAYCGVLKELDRGAIQISVLRTPYAIQQQEYDLLDLFLRESGRPVSWLSVRQWTDKPESYEQILSDAAGLIERGAIPQVCNELLKMEMNLRMPMVSFATYPSWDGIFNASLEDQIAHYADPAFRAKFREELKSPGFFSEDWELIRVIRVQNPVLKLFEGHTIAEIAAATGLDPMDLFFDIPIRDKLETRFTTIRTEVEPSSLSDPRVMIGASDGGAHIEMLCDVSYTTNLIGKYVRDEPAMTLERAVQRLTSEPADFFGISDRGRIREGLMADLVIFDLGTIGSEGAPELVSDLPGGGIRLIVRAKGVSHTIVNGQILFSHGEHSGAYPGRVLRSGRQQLAAAA